MHRTSKHFRIAIGALLFVIAVNLHLRDWLSVAANACLLVMFGMLARGLPDRPHAAHVVFWTAFAGMLLLVSLDFVRP